MTIGHSLADAETGSGAAKQGYPVPGQITVWKSEVSGSIYFLHQLFPDINSKSKVVIESNRNWGDSPRGTGSFTLYICEPDSSTRTEEQRRDSPSHYNIQCTAQILSADFLMGGSQVGRVPVWIMIRRPELEKHWKDLAVTLIAHPEWSKEQMNEVMAANGVKYVEGRQNEVKDLIHDALSKLKPFLGGLIVDSLAYAAPRMTERNELMPPGWIVNAHPSGQDKNKPWTKYVLVFNAFDGGFESVQKF